MPVTPFHPADPDPSRRWADRVALPLTGVVAGTVAGFAIAALVRRPGPSGHAPLELAPDDSTIEFDKGGVWVARLPGAGDERGADVDDVMGEIAGGLPVTGIRPTFEVDAELAREIEAPLSGTGRDESGRIEAAREAGAVR